MNQSLFKDLDPFVMRGITAIYSNLSNIIPMSTSQRRELPYACKDLSRELTTERDALSRPYWSSPRLTSAYMHYFLPWNIIRLCRLFPTLDFGSIPQSPYLLDIGSGPLTLPIALWLSRKDLRQKEVTFYCTDMSPQPLNLGKRLFNALREELDPSSPWKIITIRTPLYKAISSCEKDLWCITMGNVLNEGEEKKAHPIAKQIETLVKEAKKALLPEGKIFAVEPGTRQGARMLALLRNSATQLNFIQDEEENENDFDEENLDMESLFLSDEEFYGEEEAEEEEEVFKNPPFQVLSPCTHNDDCPLSKSNAKQGSAWCHFSIPSDYVPHALRQLSQKAGLDKMSVSLSFLYLARYDEARKILKRYEKEQEMARIISDAFPIQDYNGRARYACHYKGLLLLPDSAYINNASLVPVSFPEHKKIDYKSKALIAYHHAEKPKKEYVPRYEKSQSYDKNGQYEQRERSEPKKGYAKDKRSSRNIVDRDKKERRPYDNSYKQGEPRSHNSDYKQGERRSYGNSYRQEERHPYKENYDRYEREERRSSYSEGKRDERRDNRAYGNEEQRNSERRRPRYEDNTNKWKKIL